MSSQAPEDILKSIEQHIPFYSESIREVAIEVIKAKVSDYPIFVVYKDFANLGKMIINKEDLALDWHVNASTIEEFVARKIFQGEKLQQFIRTFKDPKHYMCLFVIHENGAHFIFHPYEAD
ncbi:MAG: hypothetical protein ACK4GL_09430 [Flavobacteriales bacterium]